MGIYTEDQLALLESAGGALAAKAWEFRFGSETMYAWNGNVNRDLMPGKTFLGFRGQLVAPQIPFSPKGADKTGEFAVHGMPASIKARIFDERNEVVGRYCIERKMLMHPRTMEIVGPLQVHNIFEMRGVSSEASGASIDGSGPGYKLSILVQTLMGARSEAAFGRYTEADQAARFPSTVDNMFNQVPALALGTPLQLT
jgi:hypothetical protein